MAGMATPPLGVLLYDRDCGFCTQSARAAHLLRCEVETVPWQLWEPRASYGLSDAALEDAVHLVEGQKVYVGHEAIGVALTRSRIAAVRLAGRVVLARVMRRPAAGIYAWVSAHRHQLPGGTAQCRVECS